MFLLQRFVSDRPYPPVKLENKKYAGAVRSGRYLAIVVEADDKAMAEGLLKRVSANL
jgi:phosphoribosylformylglycinamidine (FGAM) synthase PurS component